MNKKVDRTAMLPNIIKNRTQINSEFISIKDANGEIIVHLPSGQVARRYPNGNIRQYVTSEMSYKDTGYLYMTIYYIDDDGKRKCFTIGQHTFICMLSDPDGYKPGLVPCHKNGCKWDNRPSNIEWGTQEDNTHHWFVVQKLDDMGDSRVIRKSNLSNKEFVCLTEPLSIKEANTLYSRLFLNKEM